MVNIIQHLSSLERTDVWSHKLIPEVNFIIIFQWNFTQHACREKRNTHKQVNTEGPPPSCFCSPITAVWFTVGSFQTLLHVYVTRADQPGCFYRSQHTHAVLHPFPLWTSLPMSADLSTARDPAEVPADLRPASLPRGWGDPNARRWAQRGPRA